MKKLLLLLIVLLTTSCATFKVSTTNHDPIYSIDNSDVEIRVIDNEFELNRLLRDDFKFRYDYAQYAISQPSSFDWNNRILGNRYNFFNPYYSRTQMWNDWIWGYDGWNSWGSPHRWSPFGYDMWGYNIHYGWNNHGWGYNGYYGNGWNNYGWNNYGWNNYGQNNWYGRRGRNNTSYINGRRGSTMSIRDRVGQSSMIESTKPRVNNSKPRVNNTRPRVNNSKPRVNNTRPRVNNTRPVINNNKPNNNTRPVINRSTPTRTNSKPIRNNNTTSRRKN